MLLNDIVFGNVAPNSASDTPAAAAKAILDPKRRNDLVDEAFLEQKDILLDMVASISFILHLVFHNTRCLIVFYHFHNNYYSIIITVLTFNSTNTQYPVPRS